MVIQQGTDRRGTDQASKMRVLALLDELPPESFSTVERFLRALRERTRQTSALAEAPRQGRGAPFAYPTVSIPASSLSVWVDALPDGYEGDALGDSEALYEGT